jgi:calmodulin
MILSQEDIDRCREAFLAFDKDRSGTIDVWELRQVLEAMGQAPTEDELFQVRSWLFICLYNIVMQCLTFCCVDDQ